MLNLFPNQMRTKLGVSTADLQLAATLENVANSSKLKIQNVHNQEGNNDLLLKYSLHDSSIVLHSSDSSKF